MATNKSETKPEKVEVFAEPVTEVKEPTFEELIKGSVFAKIAEIVKKFEKVNLNATDITTYFQNKKDATDRFTNPQEFFTRQLNAADYEQVVEGYMPKQDFCEMLFNIREIYPYNEGAAEILTKFVNLLYPAYLLKVKKMYFIYEEAGIKPKEKKGKSEFRKKLATLNVSKSKFKDDKEKVEEIKLKIVNLYLDYNETPRNTFQDMELYNAEKDKRNN